MSSASLLGGDLIGRGPYWEGTLLGGDLIGRGPYWEETSIYNSGSDLGGGGILGAEAPPPPSPSR